MPLSWLSGNNEEYQAMKDEPSSLQKVSDYMLGALGVDPSGVPEREDFDPVAGFIPFGPPGAAGRNMIPQFTKQLPATSSRGVSTNVRGTPKNSGNTYEGSASRVDKSLVPGGSRALDALKASPKGAGTPPPTPGAGAGAAAGGFVKAIGAGLTGLGMLGEYFSNNTVEDAEGNIQAPEPRQVIEQMPVEEQKSLAGDMAEIARNPDQYAELYQIDWDEMPQVDMTPAVELMQKYATPEEKADPSFWERTLQVAPAVIAGAMAMGPAGALLGLAGGYVWDKDNMAQAERQRQQDGQAYAQNLYNMDMKQQMQNQLDWLTENQGRQGQDLSNAEFKRWQQENDLTDHKAKQEQVEHRIGLLMSALQGQSLENQIAAQQAILGGAGGQSQGEGNTVSTNTDMAKTVLLDFVNDSPEVIGDIVTQVLDAEGMDMVDFANNTNKIVETRMIARINNALFAAAGSNPDIAQTLKMYSDRYNMQGGNKQLSAVAGF